VPPLVATLLLGLLAPDPVCGIDALEPVRRALLFEINAERLRGGLDPLTVHPALCSLAADRAAEVTASGALGTDGLLLSSMTRRIWRLGYAPHAWGESAFILNPGDAPGVVWSRLNPRTWDEVTRGDFDHLGIVSDRLGGRPVYAAVWALPKRRVEWRRAAPLHQLDRLRDEAVAAVNRMRAERDLPPVASDPMLDEAAQRHAEDMLRRLYYSHRSPERTDPGERVTAAGYRGGDVISENIAKGLFSPTEVVERWMRSSGHRRNILRRGSIHSGLGVAFGETARGFEVVWVQLFGGL